MPAAARKPTPPGKLPQYDAPFIAAFVKATAETLAVQCGIKVTAGSPMPKEKFEEEGSDVIVVGGIHGADFECSVAFCFSDAACQELLNGMVHKKIDLRTEQLMGAASELVRIVGFQAKKLLNERGFDVQAVFPRIVLDGKKIVVWTDKMKEGVVVTFRTAHGKTFTIEIL